MCSRLIEILAINQLQQMVHEATRLKSILTYSAPTNPGLMKNVTAVSGTSDHDGVIIVDTALKATINKKPKRLSCYGTGQTGTTRDNTNAEGQSVKKEHTRSVHRLHKIHHRIHSL